TLDVKILRVDQNPAWDELEYYDGRALFKSPNFAFIDFNKIKQDEKQKPLRDPQNKDKWLSTPFERIVCTGEEVWQYKRHSTNLHLSARQERKEKGHRGRAAAVPVQHARRGCQAALPDEPDQRGCQRLWGEHQAQAPGGQGKLQHCVRQSRPQIPAAGPDPDEIARRQEPEGLPASGD